MKIKTRIVLIIPVLAALIAVGCAEPGARSKESRCIIIMIGDGMGFEQVKAASIYLNGQPGTLSFESFPYRGEVTTRSADSGVTDSAAAATAFATGNKVNNGVLSIAMPGDGSELKTLLEIFKDHGMSTGLVTTTFMTHATPAAFGAHETDRSRYVQIAGDYVHQTKPNVLFGGGGNGMSVAEAESAGYRIVTNLAELEALNTEEEDLVSGQFGATYLPYESDGLGDLPHLSRMTATALNILDNDPDGFFLVVEGGRIDNACHDNDIVRSVHETVEFDRAVQAVLDWSGSRSDTLILVVADHETGGLTVESDNGAGNYPGVRWSSISHTGVNVPVYARGLNAERISGVVDNTQIFGIVTSVLDAR